MRILNVVATDAEVPSIERLAEIWRRAGHVITNTTPAQAVNLKSDIGNHDVVIVDSLRGASAAAVRRTLVRGPVPFFVRAERACEQGRIDSKLANGAAAVLFATEDAALLSLGKFRPWHVTSRIIGFGCEEPPPGELRQRGTFLAAHPALMNRRMFLVQGSPGDEENGLIDAFARQAQVHGDIDLVFAGSGDAARRAMISNRAEAHGLSDRVHWAGVLAGDLKWGAYRQAEALILHGRFEGAEMIVAEALACSLPAFINDGVSLWREVERCGAGIVAPDAPLEHYLAMSHTQRRTMRLAARTCFERHFRYETVAARMIGAFREGLIGKA